MPRRSVAGARRRPHCVRDTHGAEFHPDLDAGKIDKVFLKGTQDTDDGYSAFEATNDDLGDYLRKSKVEEVYVTGLVTEYCVKQTVLEALRQGFKTFLIEDAVQGISAHPNDVPMAKAEMEKAGASFVMADEVRNTR